MLGIVWDVTSFIRVIREPLLQELERLHTELHTLQQQNFDLQQMVYKYVGILPSEPQSRPGGRERIGGRVRTWREQKALLENQSRPPELVAREAEWKKEADRLAKEVEEANASSVGEAV